MNAESIYLDPFGILVTLSPDCIYMEPCHGSGRWSPASQHRTLGLILGQCMWGFY